MNKWGIVLVALLLTACSSSVQEKTYYQLPLAQTSTLRQQSQQGHLIWLEQIQVADFLSGQGLVYQTSEVGYSIASTNLWGSPLEQQLANSLINGFSRWLPGWVVSTTPLNAEQYQLEITITGFHVRYDGRVIVSGEWLLKHRQDVSKHPFYIEMKQQQDGYPAMVKTLAQAWDEQVKAIASQLQQLP